MDCLRSFVWFPILFVVLMGGGFFATYAWSVSLDHVYQLPLWPFVSDTGAYPPESCLFTLLLTWAAFVVFIVMFTYYRFVIESGHGSRLNTAALVIGVISCFGITMVGSFQYTNLLVPHLIGAFMAFIGAVIYSWMVVYMNFRHMTPSVHGPGIARFRAAIAILDSISLVVLIIASILQFVGSAVAYNLLTISEWLLIYFAIVFVATFVFEFRLIRGFQVTLVMKSDATASPSDRTTTPFETMKMSPAAQRNIMANSHAF